MGCLLKIIFFIPKLILGAVLSPVKKLFSCIMTLLIFLIIVAALVLYFIYGR